MELSNINKLSMSISLALMSEKYSLTRYRMIQARNTSIYEIKSLEDGKSYIIGFDEEKDYSEMFGEILKNVISERFPKRRQPTLDELNDSTFASKKYIDIVNSFSLDAESGTEEYSLQKKAFDRISSNMIEMCDIGEELNHLSLETRTIADAIFITDKTLMHRYASNDIILLSDLEEQLRANNSGIQHQKDMMAKEFPWVNESEANQPDFELEKAIARTLTYNFITSDTPTIAMNADENLGNTLFFISGFKNNQEISFILHNRETLRKDFEEYRDLLYSEIMCRHGFTSPEAFDTNAKEALTFAILKDNMKPYSSYLNAYLRAMDLQGLNFGRDQRILGAVALNIISLYGLDESLTDLSNLEKFNNKEVSEIFEKNYEMIKTSPTLAYQLVKKLEKKNKLNNNHQTFEDYLRTMFPGAEIKEIDLDKLDDLPEFLKDLIMDSMDDESNGFDPDEDYPYPDDDFIQ